MELNEYQKRAMTTCMPTCENHSYMIINLVSEVGELTGKIAKGIRKGEYVINKNNVEYANYDLSLLTFREQEERDIQKELGDILWQLSGLCSVMGWSLEDIAQQNLEKLASRKERGVIDGNGDNR